MVAKLHRQWQSLHQSELRVSNLRRLNLEIEELETATTERDLKKLHGEKDQTYRLITYEGQYKYNIALFKKCIEMNRFTAKLMVFATKKHYREFSGIKRRDMILQRILASEQKARS